MKAILDLAPIAAFAGATFLAYHQRRLIFAGTMTAGAAANG